MGFGPAAPRIVVPAQGNPDFASRAPAEKVQQAENRIREIELQLKALDQAIENLQ